MKPAPELTVNLRDDQYWIDGDGEPVGPYDFKAEANEAKEGLDRFYAKHRLEKPTYVPRPTTYLVPPPEPTKPKRTRKPKATA